MRRAQVLDSLPIEASDFVVEIGSGPTPFRHTKLIIDKYPFENTERHGDIVNIAPVVKADAVKLPLVDQGCDVIIMSHVIEHLPDPGPFIQEAKRTAKHIYLEFPSIWRELMYSWSFHPWLVIAVGPKLTFYRNNIPQIFADFFHTNYDFPFDLWSNERFEELNTHMYVSTEDLQCEIAETSALDFVLENSLVGDARINYRSKYGATGVGAVSYPLSARLKMLAWILTPEWLIKGRRRTGDRINQAVARPISDDILRRMACVVCQSGRLRLERSGEQSGVACQSCGKLFLSVKGILDFDSRGS